MLISKATMHSGLCWIIQPFQSKSFAGGWEHGVVYVSKNISTHRGHVALSCLSGSALRARSLFCHRTRRWHKTRPSLLDEYWWGLTAVGPVNCWCHPAMHVLFAPGYLMMETIPNDILLNVQDELENDVEKENHQIFFILFYHVVTSKIIF